MSMNLERILWTEQLTKRFGELTAVDDVDLEIYENAVNAIVGDNGAGKSTLIHMLCGVHTPTSGSMYLEGSEIRFDSYSDAVDAGIETVYQDLALADKQSVAANVFLGDEPIRRSEPWRRLGVVDKEQMRERATDLLERLNMDIDPDKPVRSLSGGQRQAVAIARGLKSNPDVLILDEPTSALSIEATTDVLELIDVLIDEGVTIVLISHNIKEILSASDVVHVLHQGKLMGSKLVDGTTEDELVAMMMGAEEDTDTVIQA